MKQAVSFPRLFIFLSLTIILVTLLGCATPGANQRPDTVDRKSNPTEDKSGLGSTGNDPADPVSTAEEEAKADTGPVPLDACNVPNGFFVFGIGYEDVTWNGPPQVEIGPGGFASQITYTYDTEKLVGTFSLPESQKVIIPIKVTFPDCRSEPYENKTSFIAQVSGSCKGDTISLTASESWESVSLSIPCEANSEVCGEEPCNFPYPLPFAMAGKAVITIEYKIGRESSVCTPETQWLSFQGVGGSGKKSYFLSCGN
ncbi:MAG: hypothetical protein E4H33_03040 [Anaerolineales bacterium]|nr:MAG: hypothetical protein E4H33_03040 [Anaerolineales bacterium]